MRQTDSWRWIIAGAGAIVIGAAVPIAVDGSARIDRCQVDLERTVGDIRMDLVQRFGPDWKLDLVPSQVSGELKAITSSAEELKQERERLTAQEKDLQYFTTALETRTPVLTARKAKLEQTMKDWRDRRATVAKLIADRDRRQQIHDVNRCKAPADCGAYDQEAASLDQEHSSLLARNSALIEEGKGLLKEDDAIREEGGELFRMSMALQSLESGTEEFLKTCGSTSQQALALHEVLKNDKLSGQPSTKQTSGGMAVDLLKSMGQDVVVHFFTQQMIAWNLPEVGPFAGATLLMADLLGADMDVRSKEIADNTFLLGDYAAALKRLKTEGRLQAGDRGYQALRAMNARLGQQMPDGEIEFTAQAYFNSTAALKNLFSKLASAYAVDKSEHVAGAVWAKIEPRINQTAMGQAGVEFFGQSVGAVTSATMSGATEAFFKAGEERMTHQEEQRAEEIKK